MKSKITFYITTAALGLFKKNESVYYYGKPVPENADQFIKIVCNLDDIEYVDSRLSNHNEIRLKPDNNPIRTLRPV